MEIQERESAQLNLKNYLERSQVSNRLCEILRENKESFMASLLHVVSNNAQLKEASCESLVQAALMATLLKLPLSSQLGFAHIVPYRSYDKETRGQRTLAQFQLGYKGYIQLAIRSNQFRTLSVVRVKAGQLIEYNPLRGHRFDFSIQSDQTIGYVSYFCLKGGFEKQFYMSSEEVKSHAQKYSNSYKSGYGVWKENFDAMAEKTVMKLLLRTYAPLSVDMDRALRVDSAVIMDAQKDDVLYIDNQKQTHVHIPQAPLARQADPSVEKEVAPIKDQSLTEKKQAALSHLKPALKETLIAFDQNKEIIDFERAQMQQRQEALEKQNERAKA